MKRLLTLEMVGMVWHFSTPNMGKGGPFLLCTHSCRRQSCKIEEIDSVRDVWAGVEPAEASQARGCDSNLRQQSREGN